MQNLLKQLDDIFSVLRLTDKLQEPIKDIELAKLTESLSLKLPDYVLDLYKWHNGITNCSPGYDLLSLQEAIAEYKGLLDIAKYLEEDTPEFYQSSYFPIFQHQDIYFVVDCDPSSNENIYLIWLESGDKPIKVYENLNQMFQVITEAYLCGAFYVEDDFLYDNSVLFHRVRNKHLSVEQYEQKEQEWQGIINKVETLDSLGSKKLLIRELRGSCDERAIPYLQKFLNDPQPEIISSAASALGQLKSRESLPEFLKLLQHPEERVRNLSTHAIANIIGPTDPLFLQPLLNGLTDQSSLVRMASVKALGQLRNKKAVPPLINCLKKQNSSIQMDAAKALGKIGGSESLTALKELKEKEKLKGLNLEVVERAIENLEKKN